MFLYPCPVCTCICVACLAVCGLFLFLPSFGTPPSVLLRAGLVGSVRAGMRRRGWGRRHAHLTELPSLFFCCFVFLFSLLRRGHPSEVPLPLAPLLFVCFGVWSRVPPCSPCLRRLFFVCFVSSPYKILASHKPPLHRRRARVRCFAGVVTPLAPHCAPLSTPPPTPVSQTSRRCVFRPSRRRRQWVRG